VPRPKTIRDVSRWSKFRFIGGKQVVFARRPSDSRFKFMRLRLIRRVPDAKAPVRTNKRVDLVSATSRALREATSGSEASINVGGEPPAS
jgi:hypothetical protein